MILHSDRLSFLNMLGLAHDVTGIREDILEKDYYVTLLLKELAQKQDILPAYFKGGTALYKAQKSIRRFSEDIDLTIDICGCNNSQAKKRLEAATKKYLSLPRTSEKELECDKKGSITAVYDYMPAVIVDTTDPLQRFGYVKVEGTSFTVSEPFSAMEIEPIIYTFATDEQKAILREQFAVEPFPVKTICLERIFADKIFAAEFYFERAMYFDTAKHIYDVSVMLELPLIRDMLRDKDLFLRMINYKRLEETRRTGSDLANKPFSDFRIFRELSESSELREAYGRMQKNYIFTTEDRVAFAFVVEQWARLRFEVLHEDFPA